MSRSDATRSLRGRLSDIIANPPRFITDEEAAAIESDERRKRVAALLDGAGIPDRYADADIATCAGGAGAYIDALADGWAGNLIIAGEAGDGKTHTACAVLMCAVRRLAVTAAFANEPDVFRLLRDTWGSREREESVLAGFTAPRILVLDDLGRAKHTDRTLEMLWSLLDRRYSAKRPTIFTTQYDRNSLAKRLCDGGGDAETAQAIIRRVMDDDGDGSGPRAVMVRAVRR